MLPALVLRGLCLSACAAPADRLSSQVHTSPCADDGSDSETVTVSGPAPQQRGHARSCSWPRYLDKQRLLRLVGENEPRSAEDWEVGPGTNLQVHVSPIQVLL